MEAVQDSTKTVLLCPVKLVYAVHFTCPISFSCFLCVDNSSLFCCCQVFGRICRAWLVDIVMLEDDPVLLVFGWLMLLSSI